MCVKSMLKTGLSYLAIVAWCSSLVYADRFAGVTDAQVIWGDDFDNYCVGGASWPGYPPFPAACPTDGSAVPDVSAYQANWLHVPGCSPYPDNHGISDNTVHRNTAPFAMLFLGGYDDEPVPTNLAAARHVFPLATAISAKDPAKNAVNGSDEQPLKLSYRLNHFTNADCVHCAGNIGNAIWYAELSYGDDRAPTDYYFKTCPPSLSLASFPILCQQRQNSQVPGCPPLSTAVHASIAVGMMALMDPEPCDVENGRRPTNYHLSVFDGVKWTDLRSNFYPGTGDFGVGLGGEATLYMEVRATHFYVVWDVTLNGVPEHSEALIPRQYLGPFDRVGSGPGEGCSLNSQGDCISPPGCFDYCAGPDKKSKWCWKNTFVDTMVLYDGVLVKHAGACCEPNGNCSETDEAECQTLGGTFHGLGSTCEETVCCPYPFADADRDGDVDQADFAELQRCIGDTTTPAEPGCVCFNRDGDDDVDATDLLKFMDCATGPGITFTVSPPPACVP